MHKHWNIEECGCNMQAVDIHVQYTQLVGEVLDLLAALDAKDQLDNGFRGMGHNILIEKSAILNGQRRRIKKIIGDFNE